MGKINRVVFDSIAKKDLEDLSVKDVNELENIMDIVIFDMTNKVCQDRLFILNVLLDIQMDEKKLLDEYKKTYKYRLSPKKLKAHLDVLIQMNLIEKNNEIYNIPKQKMALADAILWVADNIIEEAEQIEQRLGSLVDKFKNNKKLEIIFNEFVESYSKKDRENALKYINDAIKLSPDEAFFYHARAKCLFDKNDQKNAMEDIDRAIKLNPEEYVFWFDKGNFLYIMNKLEDAKKSFEKANDISPKNVEILCMLAMVNSFLSDKKKADEYISLAVKINPEKAAKSMKMIAESMVGHHEDEEVFYAG